MPKGGISVYFSIKDGATQVLKTIGDQTRVLGDAIAGQNQAYLENPGEQYTREVLEDDTEKGEAENLGSLTVIGGVCLLS